MSSTSRSRSDGVIGRFAAALTVLLLCSQATVTPQSPCPGPTPACPIVCAENAVVTCSGPTPTGVTFHLQFIGAGPGIAAPLGSGGGGGCATCCPCWGILQLQFDSGPTSYHACYTADGGWTWGGTSPGVQRQPVATDCGAIPQEFRATLNPASAPCSLSTAAQVDCRARLECSCGGGGGG